MGCHQFGNVTHRAGLLAFADGLPVTKLVGVAEPDGQVATEPQLVDGLAGAAVCAENDQAEPADTVLHRQVPVATADLVRAGPVPAAIAQPRGRARPAQAVLAAALRIGLP